MTKAGDINLAEWSKNGIKTHRQFENVDFYIPITIFSPKKYVFSLHAPRSRSVREETSSHLLRGENNEIADVNRNRLLTCQTSVSLNTFMILIECLSFK